MEPNELIGTVWTPIPGLQPSYALPKMIMRHLRGNLYVTAPMRDGKPTRSVLSFHIDVLRRYYTPTDPATDG